MNKICLIIFISLLFFQNIHANDLVVPNNKDLLFYVNGDAEFGYIEKESLNSVQLGTLPFGGSYACAYDLENERLYIHQGTKSPYGIYYYDMKTGIFHHVGNAPSLNGGIPWLEYDNINKLLFGGSATNFISIDPITTQKIESFPLMGFSGSTGGGDLAFTTTNELFLMPNSGLYYYDPSLSGINLDRRSAEGLPYYLTSMAIDDDDIVWIATNDSNSKLLNMDTITGQYIVRKTFNHRINDLSDRPKDINNNNTDSDNDGVPDEEDEFPNDNEASGAIFYPSILGSGTIAFEDQWPKKGDYDFNDLVINYRAIYYINDSGEMIKMKMKFAISAIGANFRNGFGFELPIPKTNIASVTGMNISRGLVFLEENGLESGHENAVVIVFDNAYDNMKYSLNTMTRTNDTQIEVPPKEITIDIRFTNFINSNTIGVPPYNSFIFANKNRGREIHLPGKNPTTLADNTLFNTFDDKTNLSNGYTYKTENGLPWAINIPHKFRVPKEKQSIDTAYNKFIEFAQSSSLNYSDWYTDKINYRNTSNIYFPIDDTFNFEDVNE